MKPTDSLRAAPLWRAEDLGTPVPPVTHGVSVCLPTWQSVIGYEEKEAAVMALLEAGYPRFVFHPLVAEAADRAREALAGEDESVLLFPHHAAAERCLAFAGQASATQGRIAAWEGVWAAIVPDLAREAACKYWRYGGDGLTSRQAESLLGRTDPVDEVSPEDGRLARQAIREDLARRYGQAPEDVFLFPSGMAGIAALNRAIARVHPGRRSLQLAFPYVDLLRVQQEFGGGARLVGCGEDGGMSAVREALADEPLAAVFTEVPSNPLLETADLPRLSDLLATAGVPLLVDDTVASVANLSVLPHADAVMCSLTKVYSGIGDVMAGAIVLRSGASFHAALREALDAEPENALGREDAVVLKANAEDFESRVRETNDNGARLAAWLRTHPAVERVWYPDEGENNRRAYQALRRPEGGYGGLVSFLLKGGEAAARRFYDELSFTKGPSLGTDFTLVCPYVMLAHYEELAWAESCGVPALLMRVWAGREPWEEIEPRMADALAASRQATVGG